jgi:hypothetical protein
MSGTGKSKEIETPDPLDVDEDWERFWKEFRCSYQLGGNRNLATEPARWLLFGMNGEDTAGLLRITDIETLLFGCRDDRWYFVGVQENY